MIRNHPTDHAADLQLAIRRFLETLCEWEPHSGRRLAHVSVEPESYGGDGDSLAITVKMRGDGGELVEYSWWHVPVRGFAGPDGPAVKRRIANTLEHAFGPDGHACPAKEV
jgi:hypothetical protein